MNPFSNKMSGYKNLLIIFSIAIPSTITALYAQTMFALNFKLFSDEQILVLIPSDGGMFLYTIGIFLFFGGLVASVSYKKIKAKKISILTLIIGLCIAYIGLQNYTAFTNVQIVESRAYKTSKMFYTYSEIDTFEIEANVHTKSGGRSNYGLNCGPYFRITALLPPYKKVFEARVSPVDKELVYTLIDTLRNQNIPVQSIALNNCMHHPEQFEAFQKEFNEKLAK